MARTLSRTLFKSLKTGTVLLCTVATIGFGTAASVFADSSPVQSTGTLVSLGDSITFGYNLTDTVNNTVPSQSSYPVLIGQADHLAVSNLGVPGWTSNDLLHALQMPDYIRALRGASVVSLNIGNNDLLHTAAASGLLAEAASATPIVLTPAQLHAFSLQITSVGENLSAIITAIRSQTDAPILLYNLYNPFPDNSPLHAPAEQFQAVINQTITKIAAITPGVTVVDDHAAFDHHQNTDVRIAQLDIHPTVAGQQVLGDLGVLALTPLAAHLKSGSGAKIAEFVADLALDGGTISGQTVSGKDTLMVPTGSLSRPSEVEVTTTDLLGLASIVPANEKIVAEGTVHWMAGVTLTKPFSFTIQNPSITSGAAAYQLAGNKFSLVPGAKVSAGQAIIPAAAEGDYVVVEPIVTTIPGATKSQTGFPAVADSALALTLLGLGGGLMYASKRKRES